jgi:hypothetical protein
VTTVHVVLSVNKDRLELQEIRERKALQVTLVHLVYRVKMRSIAVVLNDQRRERVKAQDPVPHSQLIKDQELLLLRKAVDLVRELAVEVEIRHHLHHQLHRLMDHHHHQVVDQPLQGMDQVVDHQGMDQELDRLNTQQRLQHHPHPHHLSQ